MAGGFRPVDAFYVPESDPELMAASSRFDEMNTPMAPPQLPELEAGGPLYPSARYQTSIMERLSTPLPWEERAVDRMFGTRETAAAPRMRAAQPMAGEMAQKARMDAIMTAYTRGEDLSAYETPDRLPNRRIQGPTLDLSRPLPMLPGEAISSEPVTTPEMYSRRILADQQARAQQEDFNRMRPMGKPHPPSKTVTHKLVGPNAPAKAAVPRGPKTQLALHFARVMGMEAPGEVDSPEELAFAKAAHAAMLKMSKGQSVAKFLSSMNGAKAAQTFRQLIDAEMAKGAKPSPKPSAPATGASR